MHISNFCRKDMSFRRPYARRYVRPYRSRYSSAASQSAMLRNLIQGAGPYKRRAAKRVVKRRKPKAQIPLEELDFDLVDHSGRQGAGWLEQGGSRAGQAIGYMLGKLTGLGGYEYKRNSLVAGGKSSSQVPFMHSAKDGVRIRHREFIQDLSSSVAFTNTSFSVNPGLSATFPWLSTVAQNFEEYRLEGLVMEFKSTSADALNSTNTALGTVIMAAEYNSTQAAYINKQQMENSMWATSCKPSEGMCMPIECAPALNPLANQYIRTGAVASGTDQRFYDICNIQVATVGSQAAAVIGELWLSYDVVLLKPQLIGAPGQALKAAHYSLVAPAVTTAYFGTSRSVVGTDSIGLTFSGTVVTFPIGLSGFFMLSYSARGASTACTVPTLTYVNSSLVTSQFNNLASNAVQTNAGETTTTLQMIHFFKISDPTLAATITLSVGTLPGTPTYGDFIVSQIDYEIVV